MRRTRGRMANGPRKHHYVPQVLLAGFTVTGTKTGVLHVVDVVQRATFTSTPQETAAERDYNLVEGLDQRAVERTSLRAPWRSPWSCFELARSQTTGDEP